MIDNYTEQLTVTYIHSLQTAAVVQPNYLQDMGTVNYAT